MISRIAVVIPAADEEDAIGDCLVALGSARRHLHRLSDGAVRSRVVVVLDACRDATAEIVAGFPDVDSVVSAARCVGTARRLGAAHALLRDSPARDLWLASTDADCLVPVDWLTSMVDDASRGINLVLGTVRPAPGLTTSVERAWHAAHFQRDDHPHVHGANLGIDANSYLAVGGWRDLSSQEDSDLVCRAVASGHLRIHRSGGIAVVTSSRLRGRAPGGFADYLRELDAEVGAAS